ncbi:MAG: hypothetical protein GY938_02980 [Ketobacter sp.]|nr:hypothetical protein [Ketobacter sp.]
MRTLVLTRVVDAVSNSGHRQTVALVEIKPGVADHAAAVGVENLIDEAVTYFLENTLLIGGSGVSVGHVADIAIFFSVAGQASLRTDFRLGK